MRGEILLIDETGGLISGEDGNRYAFGRADIRPLDHLGAGHRVDFIPHGDRAGEVIRMPELVPPTRPALGPDTDRTTPWGYFTGCLRRYADGYGRARRKEYWWFVLFHWLIVFCAFMSAWILSMTLLSTGASEVAAVFAVILMVLTCLAWAGMLIPYICVTIRRFHDVGLSGWLILLGLIPYVGGLITFVITLLPSQPHPNKHGPVPGRAANSTADIFT